MVSDQRDERVQQLAQEVRKLTDELNKTRAELRRATKVIADLSMHSAQFDDTEVSTQPAAE